ncbi:MAG: hypothetical protein ACE14S_04085 [Candidatus Bathyarchaeia archaeon]
MTKDKVYLMHIMKAVSDAENFTKGLTEEEFLKNKEKQYAVLKVIEIIARQQRT